MTAWIFKQWQWQLEYYQVVFFSPQIRAWRLNIIGSGLSTKNLWKIIQILSNPIENKRKQNPSISKISLLFKHLPIQTTKPLNTMSKIFSTFLTIPNRSVEGLWNSSGPSSKWFFPAWLTSGRIQKKGSPYWSYIFKAIISIFCSASEEHNVKWNCSSLMGRVLVDS